MPSRSPSSARRTLALTSTVTVLAMSPACRNAPENVADGDDPIAALKVTTRTTRYTQGYWVAQMRSAEPARKQLWAEAFAYCRRPDLEADGAKPNCREVMSAATLRTNGNAATGGQRF